MCGLGPGFRIKGLGSGFRVSKLSGLSTLRVRSGEKVRLLNTTPQMFDQISTPDCFTPSLIEGQGLAMMALKQSQRKLNG